MTSYRIVCTTQAPTNVPPSHQHIVEVGTGTDPSVASKRWPLDKVLAAMDAGDTFHTLGVTSGKRAAVEKYVCSSCRRTYIRSAADRVADNNLDNLRPCRSWNS